VTVVATTAGLVEGFDDDGVLAFLGVPYAAPITPERRFIAPQPVEPWTGVRPARELSGVCPQIATYGPVGTGAASALTASTDFMTVNVRTPALQASAPVLVWIHGGGYALGSANEAVLQTGAFARSGVVEVTVNYRLGALGFLHLGDDRPTNRGLLDQIAALEWVRDNIASFGGDPARVTLAGRSAGGFSVATLMAMPAAFGLFSRALVQSGATPAVLSPETATAVTDRFCAAAGLGRHQLDEAPIEVLLRAQGAVCDESYSAHDVARDGSVTMLGVPFQPIVDGGSLPLHPEEAARRGETAPVPMVIGCTTAEYLTHSTVHPEIDHARAAELLDPRVAPVGLSGAEIVARYRRALPGHSGRGIWRAVGGDLVFQASSSRFADLHSAAQPVFKYLYGAVEPHELGAAHGAEVGSVWRRPDGVTTGLPARHLPADPEFAALVHEVWVSFVRDAEPTAPGIASWPRYGAGHPLLVQLSDGVATEVLDPFHDRLALWEPEYGGSGLTLPQGHGVCG
jgi:para-nitrobenzyl esterase